jgi:hypothetical protein
VEGLVKIRNIQERFEALPVGRAAISGLVIFIMLSLVTANIPTSYVQKKLNDVVLPVRDSLGLDQTWSVFAPEPRSQTFGLYAKIAYADGTSDIWTVPTGDPYISEYRTYHWQKWSEYARLDDQTNLWEPLAVWIARTHDRAGRHPSEVTLVRTWYDLYPPGKHPSRGETYQYEYYTLQVTPGILKGSS